MLETYQLIKDQLVASACDGTPMPPEAQSLYDWLEVDGWDELISDIDQGFAVNLKWLEKSYFSDAEMEAELGCSAEEITDQKRVEYAKLLIGRAIENDDGVISITLHAYPLVDSKGRHAVLGCLVEVHGQGGPVPDWQGVFADRATFMDHMHSKHVWLTTEIDELPEEYWLSLWKVKKKRAPRTRK